MEKNVKNVLRTSDSTGPYFAVWTTTVPRVGHDGMMPWVMNPLENTLSQRSFSTLFCSDFCWLFFQFFTTRIAPTVSNGFSWKMHSWWVDDIFQSGRTCFQNLLAEESLLFVQAKHQEMRRFRIAVCRFCNFWEGAKDGIAVCHLDAMQKMGEAQRGEFLGEKRKIERSDLSFCGGGFKWFKYYPKQFTVGGSTHAVFSAPWLGCFTTASLVVFLLSPIWSGKTIQFDGSHSFQLGRKVQTPNQFPFQNLHFCGARYGPKEGFAPEKRLRTGS